MDADQSDSNYLDPPPRLQSNLEVNTIHCNVVISACRRESLWHWGLDLVTRMTSRALHPSIVTFNSIYASRPWRIALLHLLDESVARQLQATTVTYNSAAKAMAEPMAEDAEKSCLERPWSKAIHLLRQMSFLSLRADQLSLTAAMAAMANDIHDIHGDHWPQALQFLAADADVITITTAISCIKEWPLALCLFFKTKSSNRVAPNRITFGAAISACEKTSEWMRALDLLHGLALSKEVSANEIIFSSVISACEKSSRWEAALFLLGSLSRLGVETTSESFNPVISACSRSNWQLAWELFKEMPNMRLSPDSYTYIAMMKACAQGSQWQTALCFFDRLKDATDDGESLGEIFWNAAMNCCVKGTAWQIALGVFDALVSKATLQRACPSEVSFGGAISACTQGSNWQLAIHLLQQVSQEVVPSVISYSAAITSCGAEWRIAVHLLDTMLRKEILPNVITYNSLINACEKGLQWELALHMFEKCQDSHFSVDSILHSSVISACGTASEWLMALQLFQNSEFKGGEGQAETASESFVAAIVACERGCQWQFALQLLHAMLRSRLDDVTSSTAETVKLFQCVALTCS